MDDEITKILNKYPLFNQFDKKKLKKLKNYIRIEDFPEKTTLFEEGSQERILYLLLEGEALVFKKDIHANKEFCLSSLKEGSLIGEMAFLDGSVRSATVKTHSPTKILIIDSRIIDEAPDLFKEVAFNISKIMISRLRISNENYIQSLHEQLHQAQLRNEFGKFFIAVVLSFGIGNSMDHLASKYGFDPRNKIFNFFYVFLLLAPVLSLVIYFKYPLETFGVTTKNIKKSFFESIIICFMLIPLLLMTYKLIFLFFPEITSYKITEGGLGNVLGIYSLFYIIHSFVQELIVRGFVQTSLQKFLDDRKGTTAVFITAIIFCVFHIHISIFLVIMTFIISFALGIIFLRHKNLLGVTLIHITLGLMCRYLGFL